MAAIDFNLELLVSRERNLPSNNASPPVGIYYDSEKWSSFKSAKHQSIVNFSPRTIEITSGT